MEQSFILKIAQELNIKAAQVLAVLELLQGGGTVPFIARYRKEATGTLDEVAITKIRDRYQQLVELEKRRAAILQSIKEQGKLTEELETKIKEALTLTVLEDLYLPYRPKRRTRATIAKEKGLEALAKILFEQKGVDLEKVAIDFVSEEKKVMSTDEALAGARDIIAEWVSEDAEVRAILRKLYIEQGMLISKVIKGKEEEGSKFKDYFDWKELARSSPSHRILAVRRGEKEAFLIVKLEVPEEEAIKILFKQFIKGKGADTQQVMMALEDSFKRLLSLSLENEYRLELKKRADEEAVKIFADNLKNLLMASPLGNKSVIAIDPGLRTGCKTVVLDPQGKLLVNKTFMLVGSQEEKLEAGRILLKLFETYKPEVIAIGNGTASRETEEFVRSIKFPQKIHIVVVNESGASIYSASDVAREEFPDQDVTVRGAVSIGRRLMDPLAELVKIDPKSIGVGQYQHDVDQNLIKNVLDDIVVSCVNQVGVEINTASKQLLTYVSGIGPSRAQAIINFRNHNGAFSSREQLKNIPGFTSKTYEQAAGFLRIANALNPLDRSSVHPEAYFIVDKITGDLACTVSDLINNDQVRNKINFDKYVTDTIGLPTLMDIKNELAKPGRDPREPLQLFSFDEKVRHMEDLRPGMRLTGVVTNVTAFGAFVDIGVHQDGLVHISQLSDRFVKNPHDVVKVHQQLVVTVLEIDLQRKRIALSLKGDKS